MKYTTATWALMGYWAELMWNIASLNRCVEHASLLIVNLHVPVLVQVFLIGSPVFTPAVSFVSYTDNQPSSPFFICCCQHIFCYLFSIIQWCFSKLQKKHLTICCRFVNDTKFRCSCNRNHDLMIRYVLITFKNGTITTKIPVPVSRKRVLTVIYCNVW